MNCYDYLHILNAAEFNRFLKENAWWMALSVALLILGIVILFLALKPHKKKEEPVTPKLEKTASMEALGGNENVLGHLRKGHRIQIELKDAGNVDKEALQKMGVTSFVLMSNKLTLVIEGDVEEVEKTLFGE